MLEDQWKQQIKSIIRKYLPDESYKIFVFGSRATGTNRKWSDVDVGILGPQPVKTGDLLDIEGALENSYIPYRVEVVDFKQVSADFEKVAMEKVIYL